MSIDVKESTKGTIAWMPANFSGAMFATAPTSMPPADPPSATSLSWEVNPLSTRSSATSMKSVKVFFFLRILPSSYQRRPISPPPRTCATAKIRPRSISDSRAIEKPGSVEDSYEP